MNDFRLTVIATIIGLLIAFVLNSIGYWYFQALVFGPPVLATIIAIRTGERWPVVEPRLSLLYGLPLFFGGFRLVLPLLLGSPDPIIDWSQWLFAGLAIAVAATTILTLKYRKWIDREWAVACTFCVILAYSLIATNTLNTTLPQPVANVEHVGVLSTNAGGYRTGGPRISIAPVGPYASETTHFVDWNTLLAAEQRKPVCLYTSRGGLKLRWVRLSTCS